MWCGCVSGIYYLLLYVVLMLCNSSVYGYGFNYFIAELLYNLVDLLQNLVQTVLEDVGQQYNPGFDRGSSGSTTSEDLVQDF